MSLRRLSFGAVPKGAYTPVGSMTARITFYYAPVQNNDGTFAAPVQFADSWAKAEALSGREIYKAQDIVQEVTHLITIPHMPGVLESMTIVFEDRTFIIEDVSDPDEQKVELRILCVERGQSADE